jgi:nucleoid-associated protein YgaU
MNKETKVGLLVGLSFIVLFGVILSGRAPEVPSTAEKTMVSQAPHPRNDNVQVIRGIELPEAPPTPTTVDGARPSATDATAAAPEQPAPADAKLTQASPKPTSTDEPPTDPSLAVAPDSHGPHQQPADAGEPNPDDTETFAKAPNPSDVQMVEYTIKKGDTLCKIARTVCGDASNKAIERIYEANRDKMPSKSACVVGKTLQIPVARKDRNTDTLLKTGKFEEVARDSSGNQQPDDAVVSDDRANPTDATKTTEVTKPGGKPAPKDPDKTNPKNSIKVAPKDALAQYIERATDDTSPQTPGGTGKAVVKIGARNDPKDALAGALEQLTREVTDGPAGQTPAQPSTGTLAVQKDNLRRYQVQKGDTLYRMAARFMGDAKRWKELYALNDDIFPEATKLQTGVKIRVPAGYH